MKRIIEVVLDDAGQIGTLRYDLQAKRENAALEFSTHWLSGLAGVRHQRRSARAPAR